MRILVVSNLYPPHHIGGYELCCKEAVDGLRKRGHEVWVLTSDYGVRAPEKERDIYRALAIDLGPGGSHFGGASDWRAGANNWSVEEGGP